LLPQLTEEERLYGWFQQNSVTAHTARMSTQALFSILWGRIISSGISPAHLTSLNPCNFFIWGCLKGRVYNSNPKTEDKLKENICREIANILAEQLQRVNHNFFHLREECLCVEGQHFQHRL
jgi:hypothetical protein